MRIVAVVNTMRGAGKTTSALGLATAFARTHRVLLLDMGGSALDRLGLTQRPRPIACRSAALWSAASRTSTTGLFAAACPPLDPARPFDLREALCGLLDVDLVVLGGGLGSRLGAPWAAKIEPVVLARAFSHPDVRVVASTLGDDAGIVGAAELFH